MREALQRWLVKRMANVARAFFSRNPSPARIRAAAGWSLSAMARREPHEASQAFAIGEASARWIQPAGPPMPGVVLYFHGGGFVAETRAIHDPLLAAIGRHAGARGLMLDYRLAPEHPFPAALEDCL